MCGITGFISKNYNKNDLVQMTNELFHRGPDADGFYYERNKGVGLGHRRLRIIDLSDAANQPMISHCKRFVMVYNGEVYNFEDIKNKLPKKQWKTNSDSEIILEAYVHFGKDFINMLNGMFAIAIYDKIDDKLLLFRDRIGIKPLYFYHEENQFIFSSEIKSLKKLNLKLTINKSSIYTYLHLGYIPKNLTVYKEVKKVSPGTYIIYSNNIIEEFKFWDTSKIIKKKTIKNLNEAKTKLNKLIFSSVKKRLVSDVPLGTFLSGGTDSSLISAIANKISSKPINTFSIGFDNIKYNESIHAKKVAKELNTNHTEFIISEQDALEDLENVMNNFDEPFADSSALPTMLVSKMAKRHVTVCLTGDGGDELFMGYGAYNWAKRINNPLVYSLRYPLSSALSMSKIKYKKASLILKSPTINRKSHIFSQEQHLFSENEIKSLLINTNNFDLINELNESKNLNRTLRVQEEQAIFDFNNYLKDDLLVKVDRASMFSSIEARVPLLDHEIVEYALNLDLNLKIKKGVTKFILKEILYDYLPKSLMDRPKWGFSIPMEKWLKKDLKYLIDNYLNEKVVKDLNILNFEEVNLLISRFFDGETYLYNRIWALIVLNKFLLTYEEYNRDN